PGVGANLADHPGVDVDPGYRSDHDAGPRIFTLTTFHSSGHDTAEAPDLALWTYDPFGEPAETTVDVLLLTPRSRGTVRLRSADPYAPPRITLPGLSDPADVDVLVEGYRRAYDVAAHAALRSVCTGAPPPLPAAVDELREQVRRTVGSFPHVVGTCAMGPDPGRGAVVDPSGGVHGVDRLSVIDASIIPTAPSGFPHLISVMLAERLAEHLNRTLSDSAHSSVLLARSAWLARWCSRHAVRRSPDAPAMRSTHWRAAPFAPATPYLLIMQ
ncbi:MAG: choline dehydrogenase, partial [Actinomycetota bacterium]|nr:choline dehydrogenase [Actinomycetota bacterium]